MIKKLILGLAVCGCVVVRGMDAVVDNVVTTPLNRDVLRELVSNVMNDNKKTLQARSYIHSKIDNLEAEEATYTQLFLYRVCSMLYQLSRDIRFDEVNSLNYYVYGALNGDFGPSVD